MPFRQATRRIQFLGGALNPAGLSAPLEAIHDASQASALIVTGGFVSSYASINGDQVYSQATGSKQPAYIANWLNGNAGVQFDGVDDTMAGDALIQTNAQNVTGYTILLVGSFNAYQSSVDSIPVAYGTAPGASRFAIAGGTLNGANATRRLLARGLDTDAASTISAGTFFPTGPEILVGQFDVAGKRGRILRNNTTILNWSTFASMTAGATSNTTGAAALGTQANGTSTPASFTHGLQAEWSGILSDDEISKLFKYYGTRFGITVA